VSFLNLRIRGRLYGGFAALLLFCAALASFGGDLRVFSQPVFSDARTGLVAIRLQTATESVTRMYRTTDGGSSWSYLMPIPGSGALFVTIVDEQHWIATDGDHAVHTQNGGTSWTQLVTQPPLQGRGAQGSRVWHLDK